MLLVGLIACQPDSPTSPPEAPIAFAKKSPTYLISLGTTTPPDLAAQLERAGGRIKKINREAGVATVESDAPDFAARAKAISGVVGAGKDKIIQWIDPNLRVIEANHGDNETFYRSQWAPGAIQAPEAWHAGQVGTGARVAVLDGGLNANHIDLAGSVDVACSASMVAGFNFNQDVGGFSHATHVAGIVAAQDDGVGTIGIAPGATIMGVKVLQAGSGSFEDVMEGIIYAANPGGSCARADIINMSLGATFIPEPGDEELIKALDQATKYAWKQGVTVIASSGNDATYHDKGSPWVTVPAQSQHVIAVSATGPFGFGMGATNFSRPSSYTNFGKSVVDLGAPGGDFALPDDANGDGVVNGADNCAIQRNQAGPPAFVVFPCWVFDMVVSPGSIATNTGYSWAAGTSMAAPAVAGVAALIIGKNGGRMHPAQVEAKLRQSASDEGKPGNDEFYGHGFVNALRAIQ